MNRREAIAWIVLASCVAAVTILLLVVIDDSPERLPRQSAPAQPALPPSSTKRPPALASNADYRTSISSVDRRNGVIFRIEGGSNRVSARVLPGGRAYRRLRVREAVTIGCKESVGVQTGSEPSRWNPHKPIVRSVIPTTTVQGRISLDRVAQSCRLFTPGEDGPAGFRILARVRFASPIADPATARTLRRKAKTLFDFDFLRGSKREYCAMWIPEAHKDCASLYAIQRDGARRLRALGKKSQRQLSGPVTLRRGVGAVGTRCGKQRSLLKFIRQPDGDMLFMGYS